MPRSIGMACGVLLVAFLSGCAPRPPSASAIAPAIERALQRAVPTYVLETCGTRVQKFGTYNRKSHSWPVRATTCCSLLGHNGDPDSVTAVYRLTRNEFGKWVAEFDRSE